MFFTRGQACDERAPWLPPAPYSRPAFLGMCMCAANGLTGGLCELIGFVCVAPHWHIGLRKVCTTRNRTSPRVACMLGSMRVRRIAGPAALATAHRPLRMVTRCSARGHDVLVW